MEYEVVRLEEKKVIGGSTRTSNQDPKMGEKIGMLWQKLYQGGLYPQINNKANEKALGIYTNYESDAAGAYDVVVGCEVSKVDDVPQQSTSIIIPAGSYAKFTVEGNMVTAVQDFWKQLWKMDLDRAFSCDFEEYQNADMEHAIIDIYISLK
ncbi:transcriptional regulator, AraC family [Lachnospiraceae bacterium KM106-2]|nr:transcriptional regulator, AraC family [Lachnospiraceae bacterium KM106-2]